MTPFLARSLAVGMLALGVAWSALGADQPDPAELARQKAQAAVLKLADSLDDAMTVSQAQAIVKEHSAENISSIFKMKARGGPGIGKLMEAGFPDGIDRFINILSRRKILTENELERFQPEYLRVARIFQAMAELAPFRATERVKSDSKRTLDWANISADFKKKSADFRLAVEEKDPKKVRLTALNLSHTCCDCHGYLD